MDDLGFNGSGSRFNSRFEAGSPIEAKQLNDALSGVQAGLPTPYLGGGATVSYTPGGALITTLPEQLEGSGATILQQFQIVMQSITVGTGETAKSFPLLTVVQGNLICTDLLGANNAWVPEYTQACIPPAGVTPIRGKSDKIFINWPTGTAVDGPGGWQMLEADGSGASYGVYLVQVNNQKVNFDPIIFVAEADQVWSGELPIVIPETVIDPEDLGVNEFPSYDLITIGSITDDETTKQWVVDQVAIGTLTMPEPVKTGPQLPTWTPPEEKIPAPFECSQGRVTEDGQDFWCLKIGKGAISYSVSNMPQIKTGAISNQHQAFYEICQVRFPNTDKTQDGADETSPWMVNGGYDLPQAFEIYYLFAVMWDLDPELITVDANSVKGYPMLCLMDFDNAKECFKETGPSAYSNYMNIQRMTGYNESNPEKDKDWGFCHTTYFNPMKFGFAAKMIAKITVKEDTGNSCIITRLQNADGTRNRIDEIQFTAPVKSGNIKFAFENDTPATIVSNDFFPAEEYARHLYNALQAIPKLKKNILVSQIDDRTFYVTYINHLQMRDYWGNDLNEGEYKLVVREEALQWFDKTYSIEQYHTGSLDMTIPLQFNGTQLRDKPGLTEEDDWYYFNKDNDWVDVINRDKVFNFSGAYQVSNSRPFGLVNNETPKPYTPTGFNEFFYQEGGCSSPCKHPFYIRRTGSTGETPVWSICSGTVNNLFPNPAFDSFQLSDGVVWLAIQFDGSNYPATGSGGISAGNGSSVPADTDSVGHIVIATITEDVVTQIVTGSLWTDRIKLGTGQATYYFSRV